MRPVFFAGRFGWLHGMAASGDDGAPTGVVLCPAFAQEEVCTHYGLMLLADRLAAAGLPTLRFDYGGTGDSADGEVSLATLTQDVARAVDCLRQECGVGLVALCGIRLGAAVAGLAASAIDGVAGVAMLAPVVDGRAYLRETRAAASVSPLAQLDPVPPVEAGEPLNTNGFIWSGTLQQEVATIDLKSQPSPAPRVLLAIARPDRRTATYMAGLREQGIEVTDRPFPDYDGYVQDPTVHIMPNATFAAVEAWLAALPRAAAIPPAAPIKVAAVLAMPEYEETPVRFGADDRLFGMLCVPRSAAAKPLAALLLHEGSSHHIGNGRAYVTLARRLASAGIASLRMDLSGMGDSVAASDAGSPYFDPDRRAEAIAGIDRLAAAGFDRVVTFGLCSGAHMAWQAGLADDRVVGLCLANLPKFVWTYGDDIRTVSRDSKRSMLSYVRSVRSAAAWRRALRGDGDLTGIVRVLGRRAVQRTLDAVRNLRPPVPGSDRAQVRADLRRLSERQVETLLIFTDEDVGLAEMTRHFGRSRRGLRAFAPARITVLRRADHHFNAITARRRYTDTVEAALLGMADRLTR